jgi:hypothetical protein
LSVSESPASDSFRETASSPLTSVTESSLPFAVIVFTSPASIFFASSAMPNVAGFFVSMPTSAVKRSDAKRSETTTQTRFFPNGFIGLYHHHKRTFAVEQRIGFVRQKNIPRCAGCSFLFLRF